MAWYDEAVFYHIYPLGLTGAPKQNDYGEPVHRLNTLIPWIGHIREIGCNALYIGPLFESVGHGYETTDYKKLDSRLGTNEDLTNFVAECHKQGIRVILDGVFNHTGRDFFAFADIKKNRENSQYRDWYCNVNFGGNNEYNDGFSYDNWGGYNLLVKLNQHNPAVRQYICDVVRFWVSEFDIDGLRLDAADVLDFSVMQDLRNVAKEVKPEFWLMGEVIHGDYSRWVNEGTLHSVTNYQLHKALYSGHNDHNYFEIAHTVRRLYEMGGNRPDGLKLYNFVDNHDVERIYTKLSDKAQFFPVHVLLYTLPGVASIYYGSEFGIEGRKEKFSDDSLRPALNLDDYADALENNACTRLIAALGHIRQNTKSLSYGDYRELLLMNRQYAFSRTYEGQTVIVTVNNDDSDYVMTLPAGNASAYMGALSKEKVSVVNGNICVNVKRTSGEIWIPCEDNREEQQEQPQRAEKAKNVEVKQEASQVKVTNEEEAKKEEALQTEAPQVNVADKQEKEPEKKAEVEKVEELKVNVTEKQEKASANSFEMTDEIRTKLQNQAFDQMTIEELQIAVPDRMAQNGPVTDQMMKTITDNIYHDSLVNWIRSFH